MKKIITLSALILSTSAFADRIDDLSSQKLFKRRLYSLDQTSTLDCQNAEEGIEPLEAVRGLINTYEADDPNSITKSVALLTHHTNSAWVHQFETNRTECARKPEADHCILSRYWGNGEIASRVLAVFYDTGIVIQRSNADEHTAFTLDQIHALEKAVRKIPDSLLAKMQMGGPSTYDPNGITVNGQTPLSISAERELGDLGVVVVGFNQISFDRKYLDRARSGRGFRDIGYTFDVDFRLQIIVHEIGHVVDSFFFGPAPTWVSRRIANDPELKPLIDSSLAALWPSHWWDAYSEEDGVVAGRYTGNTAEKFAEFFAQYILAPKALKESAPEIYARLRKEIFGGLEYQGYEQCKSLVTPIPEARRRLLPDLRS